MSAAYGYYRFPAVGANEILFVSEDDLWSVPVDGGVAHRLTSNPGTASFPVVSPDGKRVAFTSRDEGQADIYVMDTDGGPARRITFMGANTVVAGWEPDGHSVVVATDWQQPFVGVQHLHRVPTDGGPSTPLGLGPARTVVRQPNGRGMVLSRMGREAAQWKRYRGGRAGTLWIDRTGSGDFVELIKLDGYLSNPMWIGRRIYFLSDHEGHGNIYSCTPTGRNLARHTHHDHFYARWPATNGSVIVYHAGGDLWSYDVAADQSRLLDVRVPSARPQRNRRFQVPGKHLESVELHPQGHSVAVVARGAAVTMPLWEGAPLRLGAPSVARSRLAAWVSDGKRIVMVSDDEGEESLVVRLGDGGDDGRRVRGDFGRIRDLAPSPAGADRVLLTNHRHEVLLVNLTTEKTRLVHHSPHSWIHGTAWSPDGRWVAFGASMTESTSSILLFDTRTGRKHQVTGSDFTDYDPSFDPGGKYLYFLSNRTYDPVPDSVFHDYAFPRSTRPFLVVLDSATPSPFAGELRSPRPPGAPAADPAGDNRNAAGKGEQKRPTTPEPVTITFAGLPDRVLAVPVPHGRYGRVIGAAGRIFFSSYPLKGAATKSPARPTGKLEVWDFAAEKVETVGEGISDFTVSADGKVLAALVGKKLRVIGAAGKFQEKNGSEAPGRETGWVDLDRIRLEVNPPAEWSQMFSEAWRLQRDYFWRDDMAQIDWKEVHARYQPLVDRVASRAEFSDLVWEMQGELGTSHAYEMGGDYRPEPNWRQGALGADLRRDGRGVWKVADIPRGDPWDPKASSPLTVPGVDIREGDRIVAVDGHPVGRAVSPYQALADRADRAVVLTVKRGRTKERDVVVKTLGDQTPLRYRDWVEKNRSHVHAASDNRAGYIHIPDMGAWGFSEFHRYWTAEMNYDGLVIDVRFNRGGNVSQLLLQKLLRKRLGYRVTRWNEPASFPYDSPKGPMVALTNEYCGSDGDIFSHTFKLHGLGKLVGTRTWGGVTGIWPQQALVDGTVTTQPEYGTWFMDVGYAVENYGTDPDIEVIITPQDYRAGRDPQMERGLSELLEAIAAAEPLQPDFGPHPSMKAPRLPKH